MKSKSKWFIPDEWDRRNARNALEGLAWVLGVVLTVAAIMYIASFSIKLFMALVVCIVVSPMLYVVWLAYGPLDTSAFWKKDKQQPLERKNVL